MSDPTPSTLPHTQRHALASARIGEIFQIDVALPAAPPPPGGWPVIYLTDANTVFGIATEALRFLSRADGVPPVLLVGVGYQLGGPHRRRRDYGGLRTRDLTPSFDPKFHEMVTAGGQELSDVGPAGGADAFLDFLIDDLRPFIAGRYDVDPGDQTLAGSSLGGLFSLHALFTRPGAFRRHVAGSPAIWWDNHMIRRHAETFTPTAPTRLVMTVGGRERGPPFDMVADMTAVADRLDGLPGLSVDRYVFDDETHTSVIPGALSRGFRRAFA